MNEPQSALALEINTTQSLDATKLSGRVRVHFERHNNKTFLVYVPSSESAETPDVLIATPPTPILLEAAPEVDFEDRNVGDNRSVWSVNIPQRHSSKLARNLGWMCVAWIVLFSGFRIATIVAQDGSALWTISFVASAPLANEIPAFFIPFLVCVCPTSWPGLCFLIVFEVSLLIQLITFILVPYWNKHITYTLIIICVIIFVLIVFMRRMHLHLTSLHQKGKLLQICSSLLRYYAIVLIAEIINSISQINALPTGQRMDPTDLLALPTYSIFFAALCVLASLLVYVKFGRHPQAQGLIDLFGAMTIREFFPFGLIFFQFILFVFFYVAALSNANLGVISTVLVFVFFISYLIVVLQIVAASVNYRWMAWLL